MRKIKFNLALALASLALSTPVFAQPADNAADEKTVAAFRADLAAKFKAADKKYDSVVMGKDGWMFFAPEVRSVSVGKFWGEDAAKVGQAVDPKFADPLPAILDFKAQLDKVGIKLLLVPVPPKSVIYADKISGKISSPAKDGVLPRADSAHQEFYKLLRDNGVDVLDLTDEFLQKRQNAAPAGRMTFPLSSDYLYCQQDTHWSGRACNLAALRIAEKLKGTSWPASIRKKTYPTKFKTVTIKGDLWDALPAEIKRPEQETLPLRFIGTANPKDKTSLIPLPTSQSSPVLLLGDSHTLVFHEGGDMHTKGAGLVDHMAQELGFPIDLLGVRGSGATPARTSLLRRARANPNYLKGKKWVVWCFSAREWTESAGWQKVPVVK